MTVRIESTADRQFGTNSYLVEDEVTLRKDDRNGLGRCPGRKRGWRAASDEHVHAAVDQIDGHCRQSVIVVVRPEIFYRHVPALDISGFWNRVEPLMPAWH